jgi:hypothetical protein
VVEESASLGNKASQVALSYEDPTATKRSSTVVPHVSTCN